MARQSSRGRGPASGRQAPQAQGMSSSSTPIDRRTALGLVGGAGALVALTACGGGNGGSSTSTTASSVVKAGTAVVPEGMPQLEAEVRDLHLRLVAAPATAEIVAGTPTDVLSFGAEVIDGDPASVTPSGSYLGPTLHVRTGQRVQVIFENQLSQETIVHWHGLTVPQEQDGQPLEAVGPGETYEYDFTVVNEPGTYWYHPHPHHLTGEQVYRGLAGLLIVHGDEPETTLPHGARDLGFVLQDRTIGADGQLVYVASNHDVMAGFVGETLVTNGVAGLATSVERAPYRLRFLNGANSRTQILTLSTGEPLQVVATDGGLLPEVANVPGLVLTPAQRSDLWIDFSSYEPGQQIDLLTAGTFVEVPGMMGGGGKGNGGMGRGGIGGGAALTLNPKVAMSFVVADGPAEPGEVPQGLAGQVTIEPSEAVDTDTPRVFELMTRQASHWINGMQWEGRTAAEWETVAFGTTEIWEFVNLSPMAHPMHLHGKAFRVVDRSWVNASGEESWAQISSGIVETGTRDTVLVWPGQRVRIAVSFDTYRGYFLYHCHILEHEDGGMMRNFLIT